MKKLSLALSAAAISLCGAYVPAHAEVVHTKTYMNTVDQSDSISTMMGYTLNLKSVNAFFTLLTSMVIRSLIILNGIKKLF